jgi:ABC-type uncharacterized transport system substrate-binding protein
MFEQINPFKLRQFAKASGILAKNDRLDAWMIASFVAVMPTRPAQRQAPMIEQLAAMLTVRRQLSEQKVATENASRLLEGAMLQRLSRRRVAGLTADIDLLDQRLVEIVTADAALAHRFRLLTSMPGVGAVLACTAFIGRREFITLIGGAAAAWPLAAHAQQGERMRRIGVLMNLSADDPEGQARVVAFVQGLQQTGWTDGRNVRLDIRWGAGDPERIRKFAAELVTLAPDVILAAGALTVGPLQQMSRTIPIVFAGITDPVGAGFVASLARPGGNATGFSNFEYGISGKWLELLKQIAPRTTRAGVLRDPTLIASISQFAAIQSVAPSLGIELTPIDTRGADEIERALGVFAREQNSGIIVVTGTSAIIRRGLIISLANQHRLPAVYPFRYYAADGGLISYGPDATDPYRRAASYIDRILKGEKPADLPVQAPTKYELVVNLKTAKTLGLEIPPMLLAPADEVIE